ncbi:MAG: O-antigen ligase family protein [Candidatus Omnitrophica bacterium]|nr:O-antigen ligase family protein [Candidatus Omnitrophota bacterium]
MTENALEQKSWHTTILLLALLFLCLPITYLTLPPLQPFHDKLKDAAIIFSILISCILYLYNRIENKFLRRQLVIFMIYYLFLIGESFIRYGSIMAYPHIILVLSCFFYVILFYSFLSKRINLPLFLERLCYLLCGFVYLQQVLARTSIIPYFFDASVMQRVTHAMPIFSLLFCTIFFISKYIRRPKLYLLPIIGINLIIILIENHRSVWTATIAALLVFTYMILKAKKESVKIIYFLLVMLAIFIVAMYLLAFAEGRYSTYLSFMKERFEEIYKFRQIRGTGMFRYIQYEYYLPYIKENLLFGMRFKGFELPGVYEHAFERVSGHHFHSGYLTVLFYHGLFGFYLLYGPIIYYIFSFFKQRKYYTENIALFAFIVSGLVFSLAYELRFFYFAVLGIGFALLEKEENGIANK